MLGQGSLDAYFWIGTAVMLFVIFTSLFVFVFYYYRLNKVKSDFSDELLRVSLEKEQQERRRIASGLHDSTSGTLAAAKNYVEILYNKEQDEDNKKMFELVEKALSEIMKDIQSTSAHLMPPMLETLGFMAVVKDYIGKVQELHPDIKFQEDYKLQELPMATASAYELYRVMQELINNIIKHSEASQVKVSLYKQSKSFVLEVIDDGKAYDFNKEAKISQGMGLKNITSRLRKIKASLKQIPNRQGNKIQIHFKSN